VASELHIRHADTPTAGAADLARGLYESGRYIPIANFNGNPVATVFGERRLSG
jgi:hypothetical protein